MTAAGRAREVLAEAATEDDRLCRGEDLGELAHVYAGQAGRLQQALKAVLAEEGRAMAELASLATWVDEQLDAGTPGDDLLARATAKVAANRIRAIVKKHTE